MNMTAHLDANAGRQLLDDLGFLLVPGPPLDSGSAYLFVALRPAPTLRHFDPERIDYWATADGHGVPAAIEWASREPAASEHSWGTVRIVDRIGAANDFVSFGGDVLVMRTAEMKVAVFSSAAPIVAGGGHSQDWEPGSRDIAGFLARLRAAADPRGSLERHIAGLTPVARYASFVANSLAHVRASEKVFDWTRADRVVLERERRRLQVAAATEWAAGAELAGRLAASTPDPALLGGND